MSRTHAHQPTSASLRPPYNTVRASSGQSGYAIPDTQLATAAPISYARPAQHPPSTIVSIAEPTHERETKVDWQASAAEGEGGGGGGGAG